MKCQNCGYEFNGKYCPMCGTENETTINNVNTANTQPMPQQNVQQNLNPNAVNQAGQDFPHLDSNGINQQTVQYQNANLSQQSILQPEKKSKAKIATIVIASVIATVVFAGIVINVVSAGFDKSIIGTLMGFSNEVENTSQENAFMAEQYGAKYKIGEKAKMNSSSVKIKSISVVDEDETYDALPISDSICISVLAEIENKTDADVSFESVFRVQPTDDMSVYFDEIYSYNSVNQIFDFQDDHYQVKANDTKVIEYRYQISKYADSIFMIYEGYHFETDEIDMCMFEIDVPAKK